MRERPKNSNVDHEGSVLMDSENDDHTLDSDYFPPCNAENCNKAVFSICDECNYVFCEDHLTLGSCGSSHQIISSISGRPSLSCNDNKEPKQVQTPRNNQFSTCEIGLCNRPAAVYAACPLCYRFLCFDHLDNRLCEDDHKLEVNGTETAITIETVRPDAFEVEGSAKEGESLIVAQKKRLRTNKKKTAKN